MSSYVLFLMNRKFGVRSLSWVPVRLRVRMALPYFFTKKIWLVVKVEVVGMIQNVFRSGFLLQELNRTNITFVPKMESPSSISQYWSILLCNVAYKILSKILTNQMKVVLPSFISPLPVAFVLRRTIQENPSIAHEFFHTMNMRQRGVGLAAIKADMESAYNKMEWQFILSLLRQFGFYDMWIQLIHQRISTVSYSILLDGTPFGLVCPHRGLRQGDPLSPYLFIIGTEVLSRLLTRAKSMGHIHGTRVSRSVPSFLISYSLMIRWFLPMLTMMKLLLFGRFCPLFFSVWSISQLG